MNDYWSRGWSEHTSHLRVNGYRLLEWADTVGWVLYPTERAALEAAADLEVYLEAPLEELDVLAFGAAVQKLIERAEAQRRRVERAPEPPSQGKPRDRHSNRWRDDQRGRRWR
jgi:hypothetical protein